MAEVEYKYDRASGVYYLIEINPRHWDQHELGRLVGVNLSMIAYRHLTGHAQSVQIPVYRPGVRYRWIAERELFLGLLRRIKQELLRSEHSLLARVRGGMRALLDVALLLNGRTVFSVSKLSDPRPSARWAAGLVREVIGSATRGIGAKKSDV